MALKRKRSVCEMDVDMDSSPASSTFSSPPGIGSMIFSLEPRPFGGAASHLPSRTMKRYRDLRPSADEIHERTLNILYSAQKQQHDDYVPESPTPMPVDDAPMQMEQEQQQQPTQQQSLHRFWNIASQPTAHSSVNMNAASTASACEDCGTDMATASTDAAQACFGCGKHVCFSCSVSNLGEEKRCLRCANRGAWVDTAGWPGTFAM